MAHAIQIHSIGGPGALVYAPTDVAPPGPDEVRVEHEAIGVDFIDTYHRSGLYALPSLPHGIGLEASGRVTAVGRNVSDLEVGQRVVYLSRPPGAYATERNVAAEHCVSLPEAIDAEIAAATMLKGLTAEYLVHRIVSLEPGDVAVVYAAAGATGSLLTQWLCAKGVRVLGVVGTERKVALAKSHGASEVFLAPRRTSDAPYAELPLWVRERTEGRGARVVFDSVGALSLDASLASLQPRGMLVTYGNASGPPAPLDLLRLSTSGSLSVTRPSLFDFVGTRAELVEACARLFAAIEDGTLSPEVRHRYPLIQAAEAHRALEAGETEGAIVLTP